MMLAQLSWLAGGCFASLQGGHAVGTAMDCQPVSHCPDPAHGADRLERGSVFALKYVAAQVHISVYRGDRDGLRMRNVAAELGPNALNEDLLVDFGRRTTDVLHARADTVRAIAHVASRHASKTTRPPDRMQRAVLEHVPTLASQARVEGPDGYCRADQAAPDQCGSLSDPHRKKPTAWSMMSSAKSERRGFSCRAQKEGRAQGCSRS